MSFDELEGIHIVNETEHFTHRFFDDLEELSGNFDNVVLDVNVVYSVARGRKYVSELFAENKSAEQAVELLGEHSFEETNRDGQDLLRFKSTPYSRMKAIENLEAPLYISDITEDRIKNSRDHMVNSEGVMSYFEDISESLPVKDIMDIDEYTREPVESEMSEDEALMEAASELDGNTVVMSYDHGMLDYEIHATVPEIANSI